MKMSMELNDALNQQILHEYHNALTYKQIESIFENMQLTRLAKYFANQAQHEKEHGDKFLDYINSRTGGKVSLGDIDSPVLIESVEAIANAYVSLEEGTTESIEALFDLALNDHSYMDLAFLQDMLHEQVEEEDSANKFAVRLKGVKDLVLFDATFEG